MRIREERRVGMDIGGASRGDQHRRLARIRVGRCVEIDIGDVALLVVGVDRDGGRRFARIRVERRAGIDIGGGVIRGCVGESMEIFRSSGA